MPDTDDLLKSSQSTHAFGLLFIVLIRKLRFREGDPPKVTQWRGGGGGRRRQDAGEALASSSLPTLQPWLV